MQIVQAVAHCKARPDIFSPPLPFSGPFTIGQEIALGPSFESYVMGVQDDASHVYLDVGEVDENNRNILLSSEDWRTEPHPMNEKKAAA
jgi:hypothetical protein